MSPRQPRITAAQLLRARRDGWYEHHQTGSHLYLKHPTKPGLVTVARHAGVIIKPKTLRSILDQAALTPDGPARSAVRPQRWRATRSRATSRRW